MSSSATGSFSWGCYFISFFLDESIAAHFYYYYYYFSGHTSTFCCEIAAHLLIVLVRYDRMSTYGLRPKHKHEPSLYNTEVAYAECSCQACFNMVCANKSFRFRWKLCARIQVSHTQHESLKLLISCIAYICISVPFESCILCDATSVRMCSGMFSNFRSRLPHFLRLLGTQKLELFLIIDFGNGVRSCSLCSWSALVFTAK